MGVLWWFRLFTSYGNNPWQSLMKAIRIKQRYRVYIEPTHSWSENPLAK